MKVINGVENRVVFIGMDQARDELLYSECQGQNPFKDKRVRQAMYQAIDIEAIKTKLMRGQAFPPAASRRRRSVPTTTRPSKSAVPMTWQPTKLMAEAGYPQGFEVTMHRPNNRYINDEKICQALASMWAKIGIKIKLDAQPRAGLLPASRQASTPALHAGLGRRHYRCRNHADAGAA